MNEKRMFLNRDDMRDILFVYVFAFYEIFLRSSIVNIVREKKVLLTVVAVLFLK